MSKFQFSEYEARQHALVPSAHAPARPLLGGAAHALAPLTDAQLLIRVPVPWQRCQLHQRLYIERHGAVLLDEATLWMGRSIEQKVQFTGTHAPGKPLGIAKTLRRKPS